MREKLFNLNWRKIFFLLNLAVKNVVTCVQLSESFSLFQFLLNFWFFFFFFFWWICFSIKGFEFCGMYIWTKAMPQRSDFFIEYEPLDRCEIQRLLFSNPRLQVSTGFWYFLGYLDLFFMGLRLKYNLSPLSQNFKTHKKKR